jgi:hypothetical protein
VTIVSPGVTTITMSQGQGTNHLAASNAAVLTVGRASPVFGDFIIANQTYGASSFLLTQPTTTSSGAFTFTTWLNDTSVAIVNSSTGRITIVAPGSIDIVATQAQTATHTASTVRTTFTVAKATPTLGAMSAITKTSGDPTFTLTAPTSNSDGAITYFSSMESVATVDATSGLVRLWGSGTTTITALQAATSNYNSATVTTTLTVVATGATPLSSTFTTSGLNDYYFDLVAGTTFVVVTYAQQYGIDSQLWLYNSSNAEVAENDDYPSHGNNRYLDSYISYVVPLSGRYRLRTGMYTNPYNPDYWSGTGSYTVVTS